MSVILASSSPRRRELLQRAGIEFEVIVSPVDEIHDSSMTPSILCEHNATLKTISVATIFPDSIVIGADTLVFIDGLTLGKPSDMNEARAMLRRLSSRTHKVCTGVCVSYPSGKQEIFHEITEVIFRDLNEDLIESYFALVDPLDKAGAYGIQEHGDRIISEIQGSYENVMGLPIDKLLPFLHASSVGESQQIHQSIFSPRESM